MGKSLLIVESPAKAKTVKKILGADFIVKASMGHFRDLPKNKLGIDIEHKFAPQYVIMKEKTKVVKELKDAADEADTVYLAPDPDREGEAIAWHLENILTQKGRKIQRIEFHEITKDGVKNAMKHSRSIDMDLVNAQQARRVLDRLVGYKISPLLWRKIQKGLSAGRVQSVALRLICDREKEIREFKPQEYWSLDAELSKEKGKSTFKAELSKFKNKKAEIGSEKESKKIMDSLKGQEFKVEKITRSKRSKNPAPPFITSALQRDAATRHGFSPSKTMMVAQQLYEGIELSRGETVGLITYMRTDSTRIAAEAAEEAKNFIVEKYGKNYLPKTKRVYKAKAGAQEAHEAIRPTSLSRSPSEIKGHLTGDQLKLYQLIWNRFLASQMASMEFELLTIEIGAGEALFRASDSKVLFDGYRILYQDMEEDTSDEAKQKLPELKEKEVLKLLKFHPEQHFTQPPPSFNEASLIKELEDKGIGRPSTYAPTVGTLLDREYVVKEEKRLKPTPLGEEVNETMKKHFPVIVDTGFTADMEGQLDQVAEGKMAWQKVVGEFYQPFEKSLETAEKTMEKVVILSEEVCDKCGKPMAIKSGRYGKFLACTGYPECKNTKPLKEAGTAEGGKEAKARPEPVMTEEKCEKCGAPMLLRHGKYGEFLGCSNYPKCKNMKPIVKSTGVKCPECGKGEIVQKRGGKGRTFYGCDQYPKCRFALWDEPNGDTCPDCGALLVTKHLKKGDVVKCSKCKYTQA